MIMTLHARRRNKAVVEEEKANGTMSMMDHIKSLNRAVRL
jgi:hypothetical protein